MTKNTGRRRGRPGRRKGEHSSRWIIWSSSFVTPSNDVDLRFRNGLGRGHCSSRFSRLKEHSTKTSPAPAISRNGNRGETPLLKSTERRKKKMLGPKGAVNSETEQATPSENSNTASRPTCLEIDVAAAQAPARVVKTASNCNNRVIHPVTANVSTSTLGCHKTTSLLKPLPGSQGSK